MRETNRLHWCPLCYLLARIAWRYGCVRGLRAGARPVVRDTTNGSFKWTTHNAGCVLRAPANVCICQEFVDAIEGEATP